MFPALLGCWATNTLLRARVLDREWQGRGPTPELAPGVKLMLHQSSQAEGPREGQRNRGGGGTSGDRRGWNSEGRRCVCVLGGRLESQSPAARTPLLPTLLADQPR